MGFPPFWHRKQLVMLRSIMDGKYEFVSPEWDDISEQAKDLVSILIPWHLVICLKINVLSSGKTFHPCYCVPAHLFTWTLTFTLRGEPCCDSMLTSLSLTTDLSLLPSCLTYWPCQYTESNIASLLYVGRLNLLQKWFVAQEVPLISVASVVQGWIHHGAVKSAIKCDCPADLAQYWQVSNSCFYRSEDYWWQIHERGWQPLRHLVIHSYNFNRSPLKCSQLKEDSR